MTTYDRPFGMTTAKSVYLLNDPVTCGSNHLAAAVLVARGGALQYLCSFVFVFLLVFGRPVKAGCV